MANDSQRGQERDGLEIDLIELLYRLLENARYLILAAVGGALIMALYTLLLVKPTYQATSKLYIRNNADSVVNLSDLQMGSNLAQDYVEVFSAHDVPRLVLDRLQDESEAQGEGRIVADTGRTAVYQKYTASKVRNMVKVTNRTGTRLLYITVTSGDPQAAEEVANMYLDVALNGRGGENGKGKIYEKIGSNGLKFDTAVRPTRPSAPNRVRNILLGMIIGLAAAVVVITVQFIVDDRVRNVEQLEKRLGLPVLGMMPAAEGNEPSAGGSHHGGSSSHRRTAGKGRKA